MRPYDSALLPRDENCAAIRKRFENWRCAEIMIRTETLGAVFRRLGAIAAYQPGIVGRVLNRPEHFARIEVQRHDGIGGFRCRLGVSVARADVERAALGINGGRIPYAAACRRPPLDTIRVLADGF